MESIHRTRVSNEKGFLTTALLSWLPVLIALIAGLAVMASSLTTLQQAENVCLHTHLSLQKSLRTTLKKLLALNPKATTLRLKRDLAEANLKAALASGLAPWIAKATAQRSYVIANQLALQLQQQLLLNEARSLRFKTLTEINHKMLSLGVKTQPSLMAFHRSLAVRAQPKTSLTPNYEPTPNFSEEQSQSSILQISFPKRMPIWIEQKYYQTKIICGASLKNNSPNWSLAILKDKS